MHDVEPGEMNPGLHLTYAPLISALRDKGFLSRYYERLGKDEYLGRFHEDLSLNIKHINLGDQSCSAGQKGLMLRKYLEDKSYRPDIVCVSPTSESVDTISLINHVLEVDCPNAIRLVGGVHTSIDTEDTLRRTRSHIAAFGEGIETMCELVARIAGTNSVTNFKRRLNRSGHIVKRVFSKLIPLYWLYALFIYCAGIICDLVARIVDTSAVVDLSDIDGIGYWDQKGTPVKNRSRRHLFALGEYPYASRSLDVFWGDPVNDPEMVARLGKWPHTAIVTEMGCNQDCSFCGNYAIRTQYGPVRLRSAESIVDEMKELYGRGFRYFSLVGDNFCISRKRVLEFTRLLREAMEEGVLGEDFVYTIGSRADNLDREIIKEMNDTGLVYLEIGFESADPVVLANVGKEQDLENLKAVSQYANELGIGLNWYIMVGLPGQTWQSLLKSALYLDDVRPRSFGRFAQNCDMITLIAVPYPGLRITREGTVRLVNAPYDGFVPTRTPETEIDDETGIMYGINYTETDAMLSDEIFEARILLHDFYFLYLHTFLHGDERHRKTLTPMRCAQNAETSRMALYSIFRRTLRDLIVSAQEGLDYDKRKAALEEIKALDGDEEASIRSFAEIWKRDEGATLYECASKIQFGNGFHVMKCLNINNRIKWMKLNAILWALSGKKVEDVRFDREDEAIGDALNEALGKIGHYALDNILKNLNKGVIPSDIEEFVQSSGKTINAFGITFEIKNEGRGLVVKTGELEGSKATDEQGMEPGEATVVIPEGTHIYRKLQKQTEKVISGKTSRDITVSVDADKVEVPYFGIAHHVYGTEPIWRKDESVNHLEIAPVAPLYFFRIGGKDCSLAEIVRDIYEDEIVEALRVHKTDWGAYKALGMGDKPFARMKRRRMEIAIALKDAVTLRVLATSSHVDQTLVEAVGTNRTLLKILVLPPHTDDTMRAVKKSKSVAEAMRRMHKAKGDRTETGITGVAYHSRLEQIGAAADRYGLDDVKEELEAAIRKMKEKTVEEPEWTDALIEALEEAEGNRTVVAGRLKKSPQRINSMRVELEKILPQLGLHEKLERLQRAWSGGKKRKKLISKKGKKATDEQGVEPADSGEYEVKVQRDGNDLVFVFPGSGEPIRASSIGEVPEPLEQRFRADGFPAFRSQMEGGTGFAGVGYETAGDMVTVGSFKFTAPHNSIELLINKALSKATDEQGIEPASIASKPIIPVGIPQGSQIGDIAALERILQERFDGVSIVTMDISKEEDPAVFMEGEVSRYGARLGIILDTDTSDAKEIAAQIIPFVHRVELEREAEDIETISSISIRVARIVKAIGEGKRDAYILGMISGLGLEERYQVAELTVELASPAQKMNLEKALEEARRDLEVAGDARTTIATTGTLEENPDLIIRLADDLTKAGDISRNMLVITNSKVTDETRDEYLNTLDQAFKSYTRKQGREISLYDIYSARNIVTYDEFETYAKGKVTEKTAATIAIAMVKERIGESEIVYIGGVKLFAREINLASIIKGVLIGDPDAIKTALELLGQDEASVDMKALRRRVIDLRGTKDLQTYRRAVRETSTAL
jgi:radical SAM superfamily enzyme YgiQ (UPF0313 family)